MPYKNKEQEKIKKKEYYQNNKEQILLNCKTYKENNKDKTKDRNKIYYEDNKEKIKIQNLEYYQKNKKRCIERDNRYKNNRYKKDITYRIGRCVSSSLNRYLKDNNLSKNKRHWEDIVGYTSDQLKGHIERLFETGMTWDNYGAWHIDHIVPKSFFKYSSTDDVEFKYCWSLNNLQPLWAEENMTKSNKLISFYRDY